MLRFILAAAVCAVTLNSPIVNAQTQRPAPGSADSAGRTQLQAAGTSSGQDQNPAGRTAIRPAAQIIVDNNGLPQNVQPVSPEMEWLLKTWAEASSKITRLEGEHLRRVYDSTFEVERLSEGKFYFEAPDKGRMDVVPSEITQKMIEQREKGEVPCQKKKNKDGTPANVPFNLMADRAENWICDGLRVYDIDIEKKEADVMQLPPDLQGTQIMDGPLPFLFGMPPERAKRRFLLSFSKPFDARSGKAYLTAEPRLPQDAQNWQRADVILDLKTFLPDHVRLTDPTGNEITVYSFANMQPNKPNWLKLPGMTRKDLFTPDLRGFRINVIGTDAQERSAKADPNTKIDQSAAVPVNPANPVNPVNQMPNVKGMDYRDAVISLERMGLKRDVPEAERTILLAPGPVAQKPADIYRVQTQDPAAGTPLTIGMKVKLVIWNKPPATEPASR